MRVALKEWESVCAKLSSGEAFVLLRKGGILERRGGFELEHRAFLLFPTRHHQSGAPVGDTVALSLHAEAVADRFVSDLDRVRALDGLHAVPWEDVEKRFRYRAPGIHAVAVRVRRLRAPHEIPNTAAYDGCVSWVALDRNLPVDDAEPALDDAAFRAGLDRFEAALSGAVR